MRHVLQHAFAVKRQKASACRKRQAFALKRLSLGNICQKHLYAHKQNSINTLSHKHFFPATKINRDTFSALERNLRDTSGAHFVKNSRPTRIVATGQCAPLKSYYAATLQYGFDEYNQL